MTPERKAQINRRLAEFEGWMWDESWLYPQWYAELPNGDLLLAPRRPRYTADLNALARLETQLPPHEWICSCGHEGFVAALNFRAIADEYIGIGKTEAEARAEAIYQYLEALEKK